MKFLCHYDFYSYLINMNLKHEIPDGKETDFRIYVRIRCDIQK